MRNSAWSSTSPPAAAQRTADELRSGHSRGSCAHLAKVLEGAGTPPFDVDPGPNHCAPSLGLHVAWECEMYGKRGAVSWSSINSFVRAKRRQEGEPSSLFRLGWGTAVQRGARTLRRFIDMAGRCAGVLAKRRQLQELSSEPGRRNGRRRRRHLRERGAGDGREGARARSDVDGIGARAYRSRCGQRRAKWVCKEPNMSRPTLAGQETQVGNTQQCWGRLRRCTLGAERDTDAPMYRRPRVQH